MIGHFETSDMDDVLDILLKSAIEAHDHIGRQF